MSENGTSSAKLNLIRGLLAKAEATEYQPEADAFRDKAFSMMARWGLEEAMLNASKPEGLKEIPEVRVIEVLPGAYQAQRVDFLQKLMTIMGCKNVHYLRPKPKRAPRRSAWEVRMGYNEPPKRAAAKPGPERVECLGFPSDLARAELLWTSLCLQLFTLLLDESQLVWLSRGEKRAYNNGRVVGFIDEVARRVRQREAVAKREAGAAEAVSETDDGPGVAVVLASRSDAVLAMWQERHDPGSFTSRSSSFGVNNDSGVSAGQAAGRRANIGGQGLGQAEQKELGR